MSIEFQEDKKPLNAVQYAAKDYPTYFDSILARLRENYGDEYDDFASTSVGVMLVNLMAYSLSQLSWYLDRRSSENYLATARTRDAVTRLASQIGYKPKRASAASADLDLTFSPLLADVIMSRGFKFRGPSGLGYQLMTDVVLAAGQSSVTVTVSEGEQRTQTLTSNGLASQIYFLPGVVDGEYVADQSVRVFVNGLEWAEQDFITYERSNQFSVAYSTDPPRLIFGDGSAGNIPDQGADIKIDFRVIKAEAGNVRSNTITSAIDRLIVAGEFVSISSVTNPSPASGGSGPQSLDEIKKIAPMSFQAGGSAVTQQDYYAIVNSFSDPVYGSVSRGYAAVTRSTSLDTYTSERLDGVDANIGEVWSSVNTQYSQMVTQKTGIVDLAFETIDPKLEEANGLFATIINSGSAIKGAARQGADFALASVGAVTNMETVIDEISALVANDPLDIVTINTKLANLNELAVAAKTAATNSSAIWSNSVTSTAQDVISDAQGGRVACAVIGAQNTIAKSGADQMLSSFNTTWVDTPPLRDGILSETTMLRAHLDGLFDDSCKANVVTVPILVEGRDGFFQGPSNGLVRSLQTHLDDVKEVTHQVRVVSGASALVPANISLRIEYDPSYVKAEVKAEITAGIDALLRRRDFFRSLYISDLYSIVELIDGINHVNIHILQPANRLDADGNLIVGELEVITKGTVTIEEI